MTLVQEDPTWELEYAEFKRLIDSSAVLNHVKDLWIEDTLVNLKKMKSELIVGFAGMTHLGVCHSIGCASLGVKTIGYDEDQDLIEELSSGSSKISEPNLLETLKNSEDNISFSAECVALKGVTLFLFRVMFQRTQAGRVP